MIDAADSPPWTRVALSLRLRPAALVAVGLLFLVTLLFAPSARAALGYEPDASSPIIDVEGEVPQGVAIDQVSHRIYVAIPLKSLTNLEFGRIVQLESNGTPTAASPFTVGAEAFFTGVTVNPVTQGIYAAEIPVVTPFGNFGASKVDQFSSTGALGAQFGTTGGSNESPKIAADSNGRLFYPNPTIDSVQVFDSTGALQETISCSLCPGGGFNDPIGVAFDSEDNLYVVDLKNDRVLKLGHAGGPYTFSSVVQSGSSPVAVAVDPSNDSVLVGNYTEEGGYHIVAYDSSGVQFDDFGAGLFAPPFFNGVPTPGQIAVNATTHKLYVSDPGASQLRVFSLVTIKPPSVTTNPAAPVGQIEATMKATVNANFHATLDCHFEYTTDADFQANGYANAIDRPCSTMPNGSANTPVTAALSSLPPSTTYRYRVVAANHAGSVNGGTQVFTTKPLTPPTVTTGATSDIKQTFATLAGKVNPHGGSVSSCLFEYGESTTYGKSVPCPDPIGVVDSEVSQSAKVTGLTHSTAYHYRMSVTTNAGTVKGDDGEFVTASPPPPKPPPVVSEPAPVVPPQETSVPPPVVAPKPLRCKKGFRKAKVRGKLRCVKKKKPRRRGNP